MRVPGPCILIKLTPKRKGNQNNTTHSGLIFKFWFNFLNSGLIQILFQTMYAGKYMNMYGLPAAGGTEQVRLYFKQTSSVDDA